MRRFILSAVVLCAASVVAQDDQFLKGDELKAAIERDCQEGCVTFNREEAEVFQEQIEQILAQRERAAFEAGVQHQKSACRSLI